MGNSRLQRIFLREVAENFHRTRQRLLERLDRETEGGASREATAAIVEDELRGLYHGLFVIFDGGTALADEGLIRIVDEEGAEFDRYLHEICLGVWSEAGAEGR